MRKNFLMVMLIESDVMEIASAYSMGSVYVCASLKKSGINVKKFLLPAKSEFPFEELKKVIQMNDISIIAMGGVVTIWETIKEVMDAAKQIKPDITTIIGGSLVTYSPVEAMQLIESADIGVVGEGEITTVEICHALEDGLSLSNIEGVIYRKFDEPCGLKQTNERAELSDLNTLPFPDYSGELGEKIKEWKAVSIVSARSCPFGCTYCSHSGGKKYRQRSLDSIFFELDWLVENFEINMVRLSDELFSEQPQRINEFCDRIKPYNINWGISLRISRFLSLELFQKMKSSGCILVCFGIESADDSVLKSMQKRITVSEIEQVLITIKKAKLPSSGMFIFGDPIEDWNTIHNTVSWIETHLSIQTQLVLMAPIRLYPGSALYNIAVANKKIIPLEHIRNGCKPVNMSKLSDAEYKYLVEEFMPREEERLRRLQLNAVRVEWRSDKTQFAYHVKVHCQTCGHDYKQVISAENVLFPKGYGNAQSRCECGMFMHFGKGYNRYYSIWISNLLVAFVKSRKCAFWGSGKNLTDFYRDIPLLDETEHIVVDSDISKHNQTINWRPIRPISAIADESIDMVILTYSCDNISIEKKKVSKIFPNVDVCHLFEIGLLTEPGH